MTNKLEGRLKEFGITKQKLAKLLDVSGGTVGNRSEIRVNGRCVKSTQCAIYSIYRRWIFVSIFRGRGNDED